MQLPYYDINERADDYSEFKFISTGPNGEIVKLILIKKFPDENLYNLALVDVSDDGAISDRSFSNNDDLRRILTTTVRVLLDYTAKFPERTIFFQGSDEEGRRIQLYHKAIARYYIDFENNLEIFGVTQTDQIEKFNADREYAVFLVKRKK